MPPTISLVQRVQIASPCTASWEEMTGDDKSRFCSHCRLNVYNLSAMTQAEGESLIIEKEGKLCARIYRRSDGTVMTKDCPIGLRAIRKRLMWAGVRTAAALVFITAATASSIAGGRSRPPQGAFRFDGVNWVRDDGNSACEFFAGVHESMQRWLSANAPSGQTITMGFMALPQPCMPYAAPQSSDCD